MTPRCQLTALLIIALVFPLTGTVSAESLPDQVPRFCQVRTTDHRVAVALEQGLRISATFRELVDHINASDVVVYVSADARALPPGIDGHLTFLSATGGFRYVVVHVNTMVSLPRLVSLLGHELQHAREVAETDGIVDSASMAREYAGGLGYQNRWVSHEHSFDSRAAIRAGEQVLSDVLKAE